MIVSSGHLLTAERGIRIEPGERVDQIRDQVPLSGRMSERNAVRTRQSLGGENPTSNFRFEHLCPRQAGYQHFGQAVVQRVIEFMYYFVLFPYHHFEIVNYY